MCINLPSTRQCTSKCIQSIYYACIIIVSRFHLGLEIGWEGGGAETIVDKAAEGTEVGGVGGGVKAEAF